MIELKECINFWNAYIGTHEQNLNDYQYKIVCSTGRHLNDYRKMKEQVHAKLPLGYKPFPR